MEELQKVNIPAVKTVGKLRSYLRGVLLEGRPQVDLCDTKYIVTLFLEEEEEEEMLEEALLFSLAQIIKPGSSRPGYSCYDWLYDGVVRDSDTIKKLTEEWVEFLREVEEVEGAWRK